LLESVNSFVEPENNTLIGEVTRRGKHEDFLLEIASEKCRFDIELVDEKFVFDGNGKKKSKGQGFSSRCVL
jgi:hypothetical protein